MITHVWIASALALNFEMLNEAYNSKQYYTVECSNIEPPIPASFDVDVFKAPENVSDLNHLINFNKTEFDSQI